MAPPSKGKRTESGTGEGREPPDRLPYQVEVRADGEGSRVLARAAHANLARAIYAAAIVEHPHDLIMLLRGGKVIASSRKI